MDNISLIKTVSILLKNLSPRNKDIISRRFGLKTGKKETLESIGQSYSITRERVRQIEEFSLSQLRKISIDDSGVKDSASQAKTHISKSGGILSESDLFKSLTGSDKVASASLAFILTLAGEPIRINESDKFNSFWTLDKKGYDSFINASNLLIQSFIKNKSPISVREFSQFANGGGVNKPNDVNVVLSISKELDSNVFGEIGLSKWPEIKPKGVRDKAYLVLKKADNPKHFSDIAKLINSTGFSNKKANVQTVHNELIKDNRFVLVGRGMYGLTEWGYKPGTVKDVLVDILKNSKSPMPKAELIAKVKDMRMVKENTILLNLQDSKIFSRNNEGHYILKKA